jgi:hypothetical protein
MDALEAVACACATVSKRTDLDEPSFHMSVIRNA